MHWTAIILTLLGSLATSFLGSFACFVIWVHYGFDDRWQARKETQRIREIQKGHELENNWRREHGQEPLPPLQGTKTDHKSPPLSVLGDIDGSS